MNGGTRVFGGRVASTYYVIFPSWVYIYIHSCTFHCWEKGIHNSELSIFWESKAIFFFLEVSDFTKQGEQIPVSSIVANHRISSYSSRHWLFANPGNCSHCEIPYRLQNAQPLSESWSQSAPSSHGWSCCYGLSLPKYNRKKEAPTYLRHALNDKSHLGPA